MSENQSPKYRESRRRFLRNAALTGVGVLAAPLLLPPSVAEARGMFSKASPEDQKKLGDQAAKEVLGKYKEVFDGRASHFNGIGQRLVSALPDADRKTWDFRFHVLDSKEVNAFALPGGHMFMFTGLYEKLSSDDALAAVTGHEMTHVRLEHWASANAKQQKNDIGILIFSILTKAGSAVRSAISIVDSMVGTKYSRKEEDQADAGGLQNMVDAGYNPQGMIDLFQVLLKTSGNGGMFGSDILADHPLTKDRIKHAQQRIAGLGQGRIFPALTPLDYKSLF